MTISYKDILKRKRQISMKKAMYNGDMSQFTPQKFLNIFSVFFLRGLWNVPFISAVYLVNKTILSNEKTKPSYINNLLDADMAFCLNNRNRDIFMYISNRVDWGHLVRSLKSRIKGIHASFA